VRFSRFARNDDGRLRRGHGENDEAELHRFLLSEALRREPGRAVLLGTRYRFPPHMRCKR
jgi:hypothetical protein